jgi:hypothetical protein
MSDSPSLHDLNRIFLAALLPDTHGLDKQPVDATAAPKAKKGKPAAPQYTAEQLEILKNAGIEDPAAADPQTVAAILGL